MREWTSLNDYHLQFVLMDELKSNKWHVYHYDL